MDNKEGIRLCCQVNPIYICEACNFYECEDHWNERRKDLGWPDKSHIADSVCRGTKIMLEPTNADGVTRWRIRCGQ